MKKSLIALAVLAASGVASAQSTVTIYGLIDTYIGSVKAFPAAPGGNTTSQSVINSGGIQTSRFGLKGSEDLGGGLAANFVLEAGFNADTGQIPNAGATNSSLFSRQSYVGFSGGFGEVKLGKMWTPYDDINGATNAAFDANVFGPSKGVWASEQYNDRPGNSIYYSTPNLSGFAGAVMYSFGENKTTAVSAGRVAAFNVTYAGGPAYVGLAYQTEKANGNAVTTKFTRLNGSWDFGVVKLLGGYGRVRDGAFNPTNNIFVVAPAGGAAVPKSTDYQLGLEVPLGAFTVSGGYARSKDTGFANPTNNPNIGDIKRTGYGILGLYALSKRTNLYVGLQSTKSTQPNQGDSKGSAYAVGVRHTF